MRRLWFTLGLVTLSLATQGCGGSNDCTETATCAVPMDGSTGSDVVGVDVLASDGPATDTSSPGSDAGRMDSGEPGDAMSIPDVVFIDSATCPTGSQCVDAVPAGWSGPVVLSDQATGPPAPTPPACPSSYPNDVYDGNATPTSPAATCDCTCGTVVTGSDCNSTTPLGISLYSAAGCAGTPCSSSSIPYTSMGFCVGTGCADALSAKVIPALPENGTCTPSLTKTFPPSAWSETARACQPASVGGGCSSSQVCVPAPPSPFDAKLCIFQGGDVSCPAGSYSQQHVFYSSTNDGRACSSCTCAEATGGTCTGGTVAVATSISGSACAGTMDSIPTDGNCYSVTLGSGNDFVWATAPQTAATGGTCAPQGSTASGSVTPAGPTTVCCQP
jgi:hypothetical protein